MPLQGIPAIIGAGIRGGTAPIVWSAGFDFRSTLAFVTDSAGYVGVIPSTTYPTTTSIGGNNVTYGWETTTGLDGRNRDAGVDPRLAGINFHSNIDTNTDTFRVDLYDASNYSIVLALGDGAGSNPQSNYVEVRDNASALITFAPINTDATHFADAAGNFWTTAAWPGSNVAVNKTFSSTILRVVIGGTNSGVEASCIANLTIARL